MLAWCCVCTMRKQGQTLITQVQNRADKNEPRKITTLPSHKNVQQKYVEEKFVVTLVPRVKGILERVACTFSGC